MPHHARKEQWQFFFISRTPCVTGQRPPSTGEEVKKYSCSKIDPNNYVLKRSHPIHLTSLAIHRPLFPVLLIMPSIPLHAAFFSFFNKLRVLYERKEYEKMIAKSATKHKVNVQIIERFFLMFSTSDELY